MAKIDKMITVEEAQEISRAIDSANDGYWFPLIVVVSCFALIIVLLLYIWKLSQNANEKRHNENESLIKELIKSRQTDSLILKELQMLTKFHDEKIKSLQ